MLYEQLVKDLKRDEKFVPYVYLDSEGYQTIGYGTLVDKQKGGGIPEHIGVLLLVNKLDTILNELNQKLPLFKDLDDIRQNVLANMAYNLGVNGLLNFKKTLKLIENKQYKEAAKEMLNSKWATQVKSRATRLSKQMETGIA